jgi:hypothetical protein
MEHVIQEHTLEFPEAHKGEVVLHCMSCDDWVSTKDTAEIIAEFKGAPCPGPRQYEDEDEILPTTSGVPTETVSEESINRDLDDDAKRERGSVYNDNFFSHSDFKKENRT